AGEPACGGGEIGGSRAQNAGSESDARGVSPGSERRANRPERDALLYARTDAVHFLSGLLSREAGNVRSECAAGGTDLLPEWLAGECNAAAGSDGRGFEDAHRVVPHQLAVIEAAHWPLCRPSRGDWSGNAAGGVRAVVPGAAAGARRTESGDANSRSRDTAKAAHAVETSVHFRELRSEGKRAPYWGARAAGRLLNFACCRLEGQAQRHLEDARR